MAADMIGFIGVGSMGCPIAARMVERGLKILAYDRDPEALAKAEAAGVGTAGSVVEVVDQCEIVFACLPTVDVCKAVALGPGGVADGKTVRIYIETSTMGMAAAADIADGLTAKDITLIDAPVVGAVMALERGTLGVLAAGPEAAFEKVRFALDSFAGRLFYLGARAGMGQVGKVMSNAVSYAALVATCEALALGMKGGIDLETALAIINQGSGANFFSQIVAPNYIAKGRFSGTGPIETGVKDVSLFLDLARDLEVKALVAEAILNIQKIVTESGPAGRDTMTYIHYFTDLVGLPRIEEKP